VEEARCEWRGREVGHAVFYGKRNRFLFRTRGRALTSCLEGEKGNTVVSWKKKKKEEWSLSSRSKKKKEKISLETRRKEETFFATARLAKRNLMGDLIPIRKREKGGSRPTSA